MLCAAVPLVATQRGLLPTPPPQLRHPLQISSKEEPRHYSAKIAWNARNNSHMPLLATGAPAINCAIKVRGRLQEYMAFWWLLPTFLLRLCSP